MTSSTWRRRWSGSGSVTGKKIRFFLTRLNILFYSRRQKEKRINPDFDVCTSPSDVNSDSIIDRHFSLKTHTMSNNSENIQDLDLKIKVTANYDFTSKENLHTDS